MVLMMFDDVVVHKYNDQSAAYFVLSFRAARIRFHPAGGRSRRRFPVVLHGQGRQQQARGVDHPGGDQAFNESFLHGTDEAFATFSMAKVTKIHLGYTQLEVITFDWRTGVGIYVTQALQPLHHRG